MDDKNSNSLSLSLSHTHTRTHARTHARAHTHTHTVYTVCIYLCIAYGFQSYSEPFHVWVWYEYWRMSMARMGRMVRTMLQTTHAYIPSYMTCLHVHTHIHTLVSSCYQIVKEASAYLRARVICIVQSDLDNNNKSVSVKKLAPSITKHPTLHYPGALLTRRLPALFTLGRCPTHNLQTPYLYY